MRGRRTIGLACWVLTLFVGMHVLAPVVAQQIPERQGFFDIRSASTLLNDGVHELGARLQLILSDVAYGR